MNRAELIQARWAERPLPELSDEAGREVSGRCIVESQAHKRFEKESKGKAVVEGGSLEERKVKIPRRG
ncbi:hypothetical protein chiPu_0014329 [Chiloscyllium punctatum]|uniref:Uncharacterized protein n=1 Tax=Chiloscyllium punctatum TaxID=137246 RepID=A0A401SZN7_CHIPU|nr:hypothetical protein [Chiloscyllium punctatum]